ncbi:hypothetical protein EIN_083830 [Entamoeba invadens IP1]|uniref:hypothetical protein n=1 Tax=Entamoeba invadens IP1 TaxID=370355 RepID=UPI0002C3D49F|nr:hypothetical protein EIN_083830 [Entamoeba invadens IP1]ELP85241.1 hypothetical protein EIN_083830 [Entamoeba invadens IP1]|eukprot:XP_004184587.1 hypothetical protein EIN_083830 [Entamoeba invadens IP1]
MEEDKKTFHIKQMSSTLLEFLPKKKMTFKCFDLTERIQKSETDGTIGNSFYKSSLMPCTIICHNVLNTGLCDKSCYSTKSLVERIKGLSPKYINCSHFTNERNCACALFQIYNKITTTYPINQDFSFKTTADVNYILSNLSPTKEVKRNYLFVLNDIDTPFLLSHRQFFIDLLPTLISNFPTTRFILNTNSVDGPFLFSFAQMIKMRLVINTITGDRWKDQSWFVTPVVTQDAPKTKTRSAVVLDQTASLSSLEKEVLSGIVCGDACSIEQCFNAFSATNKTVSFLAYKKTLKWLSERGLITIRRGVVSLKVSKQKLQNILKLS